MPYHGLSTDGIKDLLVRDWHVEFRDRWNLMVLEDLDSWPKKWWDSSSFENYYDR